VPLRLQAGAIRRDFVPDSLRDLGSVVLARPPGSARLWLAVDFGSDTMVTAKMAKEWKEFLIQASARPWLRVVVIGLRGTRQKEFAAALPSGGDAAFAETLVPLALDEFQACAEGVLRAAAPLVDVAGVQSTIDELWNEVDKLNPDQGRSIEAVRAVLEFRERIRAAQTPP
jgi:hypothetical protein